ncbi:MAG TPA: tetratricopeptide repeat protein [Kiritimatiellia bacterium]|nr:tetratricopeptide repeat protein [Kiritimatiellia bacterium]
MAQVIHDAPATGDWERLARLCQNLMCLPYAPVELGYWLAIARRCQRQFEQAETAIVAALRREPDCSYAWWIYGTIEQDRKRPDKAIAHYRRAIALEPDSAGRWRALSTAYEEAGHLEAALSSLRWANALRAKASPAWNQRISRLAEAIARSNRQASPDGP